MRGTGPSPAPDAPPAAAVACPSCRQPMEALRVESRLGDAVELDLCHACHGIWFDHRENLQLAAPGVLALFRRLHEHRDDPHHPLRERMACPRCRGGLERGIDRTISGSYVVYRCPRQHGRFSSFSSFMVEKGFVRQLSAAEIRSLAEKVRTIHCNNCGATVDLRKDHACPYCRSAFSLLDPHAVERALARYQPGHAPADAASPTDAAHTSAQVLIAQERMRQQNAQRERERRQESWSGTGYDDELWSAGLSLLGRILGGLFR